MSGCEYIVRIYSISITACFIARQLEGQTRRLNRRFGWAPARHCSRSSASKRRGLASQAQRVALSEAVGPLER
eukprot:scaffold100138_cov39-Phaeocystis_antarctica.AAC.2